MSQAIDLESGATLTEAEARQVALDIADDYGIDHGSALAVYDVLGPGELYDGYTTALEDMQEEFAA